MYNVMYNIGMRIATLFCLYTFLDEHESLVTHTRTVRIENDDGSLVSSRGFENGHDAEVFADGVYAALRAARIPVTAIVTPDQDRDDDASDADAVARVA